MNIEQLFAQLQEFAATNPDKLRKDTTGFWGLPGSATTGINYYDLELGAKTLVPIITPLRNRIPRTSGKGGIQANWRGIVGLNSTVVGGAVADGLRNAFVQTTTRDFTAAYKQIGLEDYVTFGADLAAQGFDDVKALSVRNLLWATMIEEEWLTLGGLGTSVLGGLTAGATPTPTLLSPASPVYNTPVGTPLTSATTYSVRCVALTLDGYRRSTVAAGIPGQITFTTADGTANQTYNAGCAKVSPPVTIACGAGLVINASVTTVTGAVAYAWYWYAGSAGTGLEVIGAITTLPYYSIVATSGSLGGIQTAALIPGYGGAIGGAADFSVNANAFDGLISMCGLATYQPNVTVLGSPSAPGPWTELVGGTVAGSGIYAPTTLTPDGEGGIVEIDAVLKWFWDVYRLSPTDMYVSSQEQTNITKKILVGPSSGSANARFVFNVNQGQLSGGYMVKDYMNKYSMSGAKSIPIHLHPNMPAGTILFFTDVLPYPLSNVSNVLQFRVLRDYYQLEWPLRTRRYEYGVYCHEVLQNYFPPAFAVLSGVGNG
jgi:hypothetical protein